VYISPSNCYVHDTPLCMFTLAGMFISADVSRARSMSLQATFSLPMTAVL